MLSNWQKSFELMLKSEGGYVNNPADPGGRTNLGVTQATWENWVGRASDETEMRGLTPEKVKPLYKKKYWDAVRGDDLPVGLDYLCFDFGVNAGPNRAIRVLQSAVGVTPDGGFGPITMAAVQSVDPATLIERFSAEKVVFYRSLNTFATFGNGWLNRVADVKTKASAMLA
jgi:lysozyme family protein